MSPLLLIAPLVLAGPFSGALQATPGSQGATLSSAQIISSVFAKYAEASSVVGSITATIHAENQTQSIQTQLAFEKPSKLYIRQDRTPPDPQTTIVTSDGVRFSYPVPPDVIAGKNKRLIELVHPPTSPAALSVQKIYGATCTSILDRSVPLGIAIGWTDELRRIQMHLANFAASPIATTWQGHPALKIVGHYRLDDSPTGVIIGTFWMIVSPQNDLLEYAEDQKITNPTGGAPVDALTTWDCDLKVGAKPADTVFKLLLQ